MKAGDQAARIAAAAPKLQQLVDAIESGTYEQGAEAWDDVIMKTLDSFGLLSRERRSIDHVGIHPDNRVNTMLVPVDMQDLLLQFCQKGFNPRKWSALSCTVPAGPEGAIWRGKNQELVDKSGSLLPPIVADQITLLTARGSHGTSALRAAKFGCKSIHPKLSGPTGMISKHKVLELQPSLQDPIENGVYYDIVPGELLLAVPKLFDVLSRVGNVGNDTFRLPTVLQSCNRIHQVATSTAGSDANIDWDVVAQIADFGLNLPSSSMLCKFVEKWSGGMDGKILKELEQYERTLSVRRKLQPEALFEISKLDFMHAPRYIPVAYRCLSSCRFSFVFVFKFARITITVLCEHLLAYKASTIHASTKHINAHALQSHPRL
jgi:hypothetical protein